MRYSSMTEYNAGPGTFLVCVDTYENGVACGVLHSGCVACDMPFHGLSGFIRAADEVMDQMAFPQAYWARRGFLDTAPREDKTEFAEKRRRIKQYHAWRDMQYRRGKAATFWIMVLYRKNGSWQGRAVWTPARQAPRTFEFRSALELILAMDDVLRFPQKTGAQADEGTEIT